MARAIKNAMRSSGPRKVMMAGIEWEEQYGIYRAVLNGWMELQIVHENEFYVQVAERRLAARPEVVEDAAILARKKAVAMAQGIVDLLEGGK